MNVIQTLKEFIHRNDKPKIFDKDQPRTVEPTVELKEEKPNAGI